jgi:hypothetical protein
VEEGAGLCVSWVTLLGVVCEKGREEEGEWVPCSINILSFRGGAMLLGWDDIVDWKSRDGI